MHIIKLNAIDSTNTYLKTMAMHTQLKDFTVVITENQTDGRGQMGKNWNSEIGKNLTASVFVNLSFLKIEQQFYISLIAALALYKTLYALKLPQLYIKWPNDILSANKKICGILIETVIKKNKLKGAVIGFGLNVNQVNFETLPRASSLRLLMGVKFDKDNILTNVIKHIKFYYKTLKQEHFKAIKTAYESVLYRRGKISTFKLKNDELISAIITGVTDSGKLVLTTEGNNIQTFDNKELSFLATSIN